MSEGKGKCSYCGGVISPHATICRHCGKYIQAVIPRKLAHLPKETHRKHRSYASVFFNIGVGTITILFLSAVALMAIPATTTQASGAASPSTSPVLASIASDVSMGSPVVSEMSAASGGSGGGDVYEPPVVGQAGDCIDGSIIDLYHQAAGFGWTIDVVGPTTDTITADINGRFHFPSPAWLVANDPDNLGTIFYPAGTYTLTLTAPSGWVAFTPITFTVNLTGNHEDGCALVRFKMEAKAKLCVTKLDVVGNVGLPGWVFSLKNVATGEVLTATTNGQGIACFPDMLPGDYVVDEAVQVGWLPVSPTQVPITLVSPMVPGSVVNLYFYNKEVHKGTICVEKKDAAGNLLNGWQITMTRPDGLFGPQTQVTGSHGTGLTCFDDLALGEWEFDEVAQTWWGPVGQYPQTVILTIPGETKTITFVNEPLGCVDGTKINDSYDPLRGWKITAQKGDVTYTTLTDQLGYFKFALPLGTWTISEELQNGWTPVTPASFDVTVTKQGPACEHVRFKNATKYACVDVFKEDGYDGVGLAGWEVNIEPAFPHDPTGWPLSGITDGSGWYRFNGLTPGNYTLWDTAQTGWTACGVEPYSINPAETQIELVANGRCAVVVFKNCQDHQLITLLDP